MDAISIRGIRAQGRHGLEAIGERDRPQPFVVDVELRRDLRSAAEADDLSSTTDYVDMAKAVREVVERESFELVETLADAIASRLLDFGGDSVRVHVSKPNAAAAVGVDAITVIVERSAR